MSAVTDRRRNQGPEVSVRPLPTTATPAKPLLDGNYARADGRFPEQLRPCVVSLGVVSRAAGSAYIEMGGTKLICSVYGPRSPTSRSVGRGYQTLGNVSCEIIYAPFSATQRCPHQPEAEEQSYSTLLLEAVCPVIRRELFPNSYVDIYITVLQRCGSILAAAINAASAALVQAGVEMLDSVVACSAVLAPSENVYLMDPTAEEASQSPTQFTLAFLPGLNQMTHLHMTGPCELAPFGEAVALGIDGVRALYDSAIRPALETCLAQE